MGGLYSTLSMGLAYCFCSSASSVCNSCLGDTSTSGRKRSVLLLAFTVFASLFFQYYVAPSILEHTGWWNVYRSLPGMGRYVYDSWTSGCEYADTGLVQSCVGNSGAYRPTFVSFLFFIASAIATKVNPAMNSQVWPAKFALFFFALIGTMFLPNSPILDSFFVIITRISAMIFIVIQQVILIDVAYNWNERWVERSDECDRYEYGSGMNWLRAILAACVALYGASAVGIGLLYHYFTGCSENTAVITLTWIAIVIITALQLSGTEGSLLTSSVMSAYATYLAFSVVSKNPNSKCNPNLGGDDVWGIVVGMILTAVSLAWTGWSWTAENRLNREGVQATRSVPSIHMERQDPDALNLDVPFLDPDQQPTTGLVVDAASSRRLAVEAPTTSLWKLNVVLALVSCWVAVSLTGWGSLQSEHAATNPQAGKVNMIMIGISELLALSLYAWTLVAPMVFPDRDFS